jgi:hypothetical protein
LLELSRALAASKVAEPEPRRRARGEEEPSPSPARQGRAHGGRIRRSASRWNSMVVAAQPNRGSPHLLLFLPLLPCGAVHRRRRSGAYCGSGGGRELDGGPRSHLQPPTPCSSVFSGDGRKGIRSGGLFSLLRLTPPLQSVGANCCGRCVKGCASAAGSGGFLRESFFSLLSSLRHLQHGDKDRFWRQVL